MTFNIYEFIQNIVIVCGIFFIYYFLKGLIIGIKRTRSK